MIRSASITCPRRGLFFVLLVAAMFCGTAVPAWGDTIWRKNGAKLVGKIVAEEEKRIQVEIAVGKGKTRVWIDRAEVQRIERGLTPREDYQARLAKLAPHDLPGLMTLIDWAKKQRLVGEVATLEGKVAAVTRLHRMHKHPRRWCRTCSSHGKVPCPDCAGKGVLRDPCEACSESGEMRCKVCGHLDEPGELRCRKCAGKGEVERFNPAKGRKVKKRCDSCKGKGKHECPECKGNGISACAVCAGTKGVERPCPTCEQEPMRSCPTCFGVGLQPEPISEEAWRKEQAAAAEGKKSADPTAGDKTPAEPPPASNPGEHPGGAPEKKPAATGDAKRSGDSG